MSRGGPLGSVDGGEGQEPIARRGYHHGHLRQALLTAARHLLAKHGPSAFSLADAAKIAGVSAAAPYRHFRDREALLGTVAREGFETFGQRLGAAMTGHRSPQEAFAAMGRAYLAFAREEPGLYAAMFSSDVALDTEGRAAADIAFTALTRGIGSMVAPAGPPATLDVHALALQVWSFSHGVASLERSGCFRDGTQPERILLDGVAAIVSGALRAARVRPPAAPPDP